MKPSFLKSRFFLLPLFVILLAAVYFSYLKIQGNFHAITPGEAYRSGQLDRDQLAYYIKKYGIKSILNLRGKNPGSSWYKEELSTCKEYNVRHYDLGMSAEREPSIEAIGKVIEIFRHAPRPLLIHCRFGADRSGLAAAIWKVVVEGKSKSEAAKELSIVYGHVFFGKASAMDRFFRKWTPDTINSENRGTNQISITETGCGSEIARIA